MIPALSLAGLLAFAPYQDLPIHFFGITPEVADLDALPFLKPAKTKAVVLIHGLLARPLKPEKATMPEAHTWQNSKGELVKTLAPDFDVFGLSYAQTVPVDFVPWALGLRRGVELLRLKGYTEIALVGHSAGGIIARGFAGQFPDSGVTKVVTVAAPHRGSGWTNLPERLWPRPQVPFIESLSEGYRANLWKSEPELPKNLEFCCIVCKFQRFSSDTIVGVKSQWPGELQQLGIPIKLVKCSHFDAMTCQEAALEIQDALKNKIVRWSPEETDKAKRYLFGEKEK